MAVTFNIGSFNQVSPFHVTMMPAEKVVVMFDILFQTTNKKL